MSSGFKLIRKRITPGLINELKPVALDSIISYLDESINANPDQLQVALLAGITAFLSTLRNGGQHDQAYRAAIASSKSVSHAVDSANIISDRYRSPRKKTMSTIRAASGLIKRAALSTLTGFPEDIKEKIGDDIEGITNLFTLIPKHSTTKGRGLFGAGIGGFENNLNTEWLNPNDDDVASFTGSGFWDFLGLSSDTPNPLPTPGTTAYEPQTTSYDPATQSSIWDDPNLVSTDADAPSPGFWGTLGKGLLSLGTGAVGLLSGNPMLQSLALQAAVPVAKAVFPVLGKGLHMLGDATYGTFRRYIKRNDWEDNSNTGFFGKIGHGMARGLKSMYKWNDSQINAVNEWAKKHEMQKSIGKLGATIGQLAPALGQDYLAYKQKMQAYQKQQQQAKAQFDYEQKKEQQEIERQNAEMKAKNARERQEALMYNSDKMAEYADELEYLDELKKHDEKVKQAKEEYLDNLEDFQRIKNEEKRDDLTAAAKREARDGWIDAAGAGIATALTGLSVYLAYSGAATSATGVGGVVGVPLLAASGLAAAAGTAIHYFTNANESKERALKLSEEAARAEAVGDLTKAAQLDKEAMKEAKSIQENMAKGFEANEKLSKERAKVEAERTKAYMNSAQDVVKGVTNVAHGVNKAWDASERAERYANMSVEPAPTDRSGLEIAPRKKPRMASLKYVPDEMTDDDPRLKKFIAKEFFEAPLPTDIYSTTNTAQAVQRLPAVLAAYDKPKQESIPMPELPYVNPLPVHHVNPGSGSNNSLRTRPVLIQRSPALVRPTPMMGNSLNTLQPRKRGRKF